VKAFQFRLQRVLDWRRAQLQVEEMKLRQHTGAIAELDRARAELDEAKTTANAQVRHWTALQGSDLAALDGFLARLRRHATQIERERATRVQAMQEQQRVTMDASRRCRLLERLQARRREEWQAAADRELENFAGEAYLARLVRASGGAQRDG
jgi:hypothetical protein